MTSTEFKRANEFFGGDKDAKDFRPQLERGNISLHYLGEMVRIQRFHDKRSKYKWLNKWATDAKRLNSVCIYVTIAYDK